jgi:O-antigen ligase
MALWREQIDSMITGRPRVAQDHEPRLLGPLFVLAIGLGCAIASVEGTALGLAIIGLVLIAGLLLFWLDLAVAVLAATFFFNAYLNHGAGILTIDKAVGILAVLAWGLDWAVHRRRVLHTPQLWLICAFLLWTCVSVSVSENDKAALITSLRYVTFGVLYFLVLQAVRGDRRRAEVLVRVVVLAAAVASVVGLAELISGHVSRASGPLMDPNDFGFILASTLPLAIFQVRWDGPGWRRVGWICAVALILACTLATFSRSALTGLALAACWAVGTGRVRLRWVAGAVAFLGAIAGLALLVTPRLVQADFGDKASVATRNVNIRFGYYRVELQEWEHNPITGVGPGNFVYRFFQYAPAAHESLPFPSNVTTISGEEAYLVILAEQGAPGLALFAGYLAWSWLYLRRRFPAGSRADQLQAACAAGFIVACVGALFLAEQYYPPLWFLPALGASLAAGPELASLAAPAPRALQPAAGD